MASLFSTGTAFFFVGIDPLHPLVGTRYIVPGASGDVPGTDYKVTIPRCPLFLLFLGTAKFPPKITTIPVYRPIYDDNVSKEIPADYTWDGEWGIVTCELNLYNEGVFEALAARPIPGTPRGKYLASDVGRLILSNSYSHELFVTWPKANQLVGLLLGQPAGYHFYTSVLFGPDELSVGSTAKSIRMVWHCLPARDPDGDFQLYENLMLTDCGQGGSTLVGEPAGPQQQWSVVPSQSDFQQSSIITSP